MTSLVFATNRYLGRTRRATAARPTVTPAVVTFRARGQTAPAPRLDSGHPPATAVADSHSASGRQAPMPSVPLLDPAPGATRSAEESDMRRPPHPGRCALAVVAGLAGSDLAAQQFV